MFTLKDAEYHGVKFDFHGDTKQDLVEALAGIDYYLARANALLSSEVQPDKETEAPQEDKPAEKPKSTRRRSTAKKDKAAEQTEKEAEQDKAEPEKGAAGDDKTEDMGKAADDTPAEAPAYTVEEVKARLQEYIDAFGAVQAKELLGKYEVKKRSELTDEQLPKFMADMEDRLEAGG